MGIKYASVCSGVEAPTVAWHHMGWKPQWFCEFDKFPSAVLNHHYPSTPNLGDMTKLREKNEYNTRNIDLLIGGTPCQSFSVAGLRKGLEDPRGNLALEFVRILADKRPRWFVWENVPGVLSSGQGRDFASIISAFEKVGYGVCWRVLDAQFFGVPQRRRRVFVVGYLGDWRPSYRVLFESESLRGNIEAGRKKRKEDPRGAGESIKGTGPLKAQPGTCVDGMSKTHTSIYIPQVVSGGTFVRKLTPIEYERLQGFPDNYTQISWRGKPAEDCPKGLRYKAMGNSMAVPVMKWIGERIQAQEGRC